MIIDSYRFGDPDVSAYLEQLSVQPSSSYITALTTLVSSLKSDGNWTQLDRFWIHATEQQQHARVSLVNPTSTQLTEVNAPTWTANQGYTGGSGKYINSNYNISTGVNFTQNNCSMGVYSRTNVDNFYVDMGLYNGVNTFSQLDIRDGGLFWGWLNNLGAVTAANTDSRGLHSLSRPSSTTMRVIRNGTQIGTSSAVSTNGLPNLNLYILARNSNGTANVFSSRQISISYIGSGNIDHSTFYTAIQTFATTIGFNV